MEEWVFTMHRNVHRCQEKQWTDWRFIKVILLEMTQNVFYSMGVQNRTIRTRDMPNMKDIYTTKIYVYFVRESKYGPVKHISTD